MQGKRIKQVEKISKSTDIDISDLPRGSYIINMIDNDKTLSNKTFIVD